jgi:hypothetical protein
MHDELAQKYNSSKSEISNLVTSYLIRNKKTSNTTQFRIEECVKAGYTVNDLMVKFRLKHKQARGFWLLYGTQKCYLNASFNSERAILDKRTRNADP